ncbi:MAG: hypothetical protein KME60_12125 [Cyanomargarita calcarea GSE-NOS-MK-12-04C]|uniref:Uncharacterized protein n=1 Tax=Cyanomargarita calcarea GSE-NOS-MK-12-04C TaxID=2839659 RepID=A0A951QNC8_9CYAN|nr:hypothetical protein [Cyanomargarita calcarea GSE-NOS-MK-12-04C]
MKLLRIRIRPLINLLFFGTSFILFLTNLIFQVLSFVEPLFNGLAVSLFLLIPFLLIVNGFLFTKWWQKIINLLFFIVPSLVSILVFSNQVILLFISVYQPDQEIKLRDYNIAIYKTSGFFIESSQGFILKQEKVIFPGIKLMKKVYQNNNFSLYDIDYKKNGDKRIILDFIYFDEKGKQQKYSQQLELKKFIYF